MIDRCYALATHEGSAVAETAQRSKNNVHLLSACLLTPCETLWGAFDKLQQSSMGSDGDVGYFKHYVRFDTLWNAHGVGCWPTAVD